VSCAANGICASVLGVTYVLRAVGDTAGPHGPRWASWLSPVGWGQLARPYAGDRWAVLLVFVGFVAVMVAVASALAARRDLGAGLLRERRGRATAAPWLRTSGALAWRLQGGLLAWWMLAFAFLGVVLGSLASSVSSIVSSQQAHDMITRLGGVRGLTDAFLAAELGIAGVIASAFAVQATMRLRSEETAQRAEPVLATAVGRVTWAASHLVVALVGTAAMLLATGVAAGTVRAVQTGHSSDFWHLVAGALVQLPAVWLLAGITLAAFGLVPQATAAGWAALVVFLLIGELGPLFQLKQWALDLSPFAHIPHLPGGTVSAAPLLWLLAIAALLVVAGLVGFRRRDLEP
jgi:ABC-2 type transport system permease protein